MPTGNRRAAVVELSIAAPAEEVWAALREPELLRRWHGWEYDGLDEEIDEIYGAGAIADEAARTLEIAGTDDRFELAGEGDGTRLRITRAAEAAGDERDEAYDPVREGWISFAHQLRFALERHPGEDRRSAYVEDAAPAPAADAAGEVWFRSRHQLGLVVDGGLVILQTEPAGPTHAIVTAYGVDDAGLADAAARWAA